MSVLHPASLIPADVPDLSRFVTDVAERIDASAARQDSVANNEAPVFVARAPGRLDVMGGIADYSGSLVLQWPILEATRVAVRPWPAPRISITSVGRDRPVRHCDVPLDLVADPGSPYADVRAWFAAEPNRHWAAYVAGVFHVLAREHGVRFSTGAAILVESDVPEGKGVSSSAAIEAAPFGVRVNAVAPSLAMHEFLSKVTTD